MKQNILFVSLVVYLIETKNGKLISLDSNYIQCNCTFYDESIVLEETNNR